MNSVLPSAFTRGHMKSARSIVRPACSDGIAATRLDLPCPTSTRFDAAWMLRYPQPRAEIRST